MANNNKAIVSATTVLFILGGLYFALSKRDPTTDPLDQAGAALKTVTNRILGTPETTETDDELGTDGTTGGTGLENPPPDPASDTNADGSNQFTTCGVGTIKNSAGLCVPDPNYNKQQLPPTTTINPTTTPNPVNTVQPRPFGNTNNLYNYLSDRINKGDTPVYGGFGNAPAAIVTRNAPAPAKATRTPTFNRNNNLTDSLNDKLEDDFNKRNNIVTPPTPTPTTPAAPMNTKTSNGRGCVNCNATSNGKPISLSTAGQSILDALAAYRRGAN